MTLMEPSLIRPKPTPPTPLARWIRRTGVTGAELARAVGVDKGTISRAARGGPMSDKLRDKIKRATGLHKL